jgi:hypothetical protein
MKFCIFNKLEGARQILSFFTYNQLKGIMERENELAKKTAHGSIPMRRTADFDLICEIPDGTHQDIENKLVTINKNGHYELDSVNQPSKPEPKPKADPK